MNRKAKKLLIFLTFIELLGLTGFYIYEAIIDPPPPEYSQNVYCPINT